MRDSNPFLQIYRGGKLEKTKITPNGVIPYPLLNLAGCESLNWHPFLSDFILVGHKLEQLGFTYFKGTVTVIDPSEVR